MLILSFSKDEQRLPVKRLDIFKSKKDKKCNACTADYAYYIRCFLPMLI